MLLLMIVSVALMIVDHRTDHVQNIRSGISVLVYPLQYVVSIPGNMTGWASESLSSRETLLEENENLRTQNQLLKAQLQKLTFIESENIHLRELLQSSKRVGERILIGELLAVSLDPYKRQVAINKGTVNDELYEGQPLLDAQGVMGKLVHVYPFTSTALLITDPNHILPIQVARNGLRAIATGTGNDDRLELPHLPNNADIKVGDLLVTSGLGCIFPAGYPAARVVEVNINPSLPFAQVYAEPIAKLERSREVLLVWPSTKTRPEMQNPCLQVESEGQP
jgi:rod shape-determining protein MreC